MSNVSTVIAYIIHASCIILDRGGTSGQRNSGDQSEKVKEISCLKLLLMLPSIPPVICIYFFNPDPENECPQSGNAKL